MNRHNISILTSVRFFVAVFVVIFHYGNKQQIFSEALSGFGNEAVVFFFMLSGFVLTYAHVNISQNEYVLNVSARKFLVLRMARILPAYLFGLLIAGPFLIYGYLVSHVLNDQIFWTGFILVPLFLQSWYPPAALMWNAPSWSLSVELLFYVSFPLIVKLIKFIPKWKFLLLAYITVLFVSIFRQTSLNLFDTTAWHNFIYYFPLFHLPVFIFGIALALIYLQTQYKKQLYPIIFWLGIVGIIFIIIFSPSLPWLTNTAILSLPFAGFIFGSTKSINWLTGQLSTRVFCILGESSYAIYILHVPISIWWNKLIILLHINIDPWLDFLGYFIVMLFGSICTFYSIEKPARNHLRKLFL